VVHDLFVTETARYADFLLPAASFIEQMDLLFPWGQTYLTLNRPAIPPREEALCNTDLFRRLAGAMGWRDPEFEETDEQLIRRALATDHPYMRGIDFERLWEEGWAPLELPEDRLPFAEGGFPTPSGKCELFRDPEPRYVAPPPDAYPLTMLSAKTALHFLNSSYSNLPRHARAEGAPTVSLDPADAAARRISDGDMVRVWNDRGSLELPARVGDGVRPGVVAIPHGFSANFLTSDGIADAGGGGDFYDTRVEVSST
jgi:anaerobic selenocysteine-containing dehydrogenase